MFDGRMRRGARAALLVLALAASVPTARAAEVDTPVGVDGAKNLAAYGSCAGGLAFASTFPQAWTALAICFKILADEWDRTF